MKITCTMQCVEYIMKNSKWKPLMKLHHLSFDHEKWSSIFCLDAFMKFRMNSSKSKPIRYGSYISKQILTGLKGKHLHSLDVI